MSSIDRGKRSGAFALFFCLRLCYTHPKERSEEFIMPKKMKSQRASMLLCVHRNSAAVSGAV